MPDDVPRIDVSNTKVFDYQREVIVELHGRTPSGEFTAISYTFRADPDEETRLQSPEIESAHVEVVQEALFAADYTLT
jgi:hypothetical protein